MKKTPSKLGRNQPCHCGSGRKYKYCHLAADKEIPTPPENDMSGMSREGVGFFNLASDMLSKTDYPIYEFCLDNDIYFFKNLSINDYLIVISKHEEDTLSVEILMEYWEKSSSQEYFLRMLKNSENLNSYLNAKKEIIKQIIDAHFKEMYAISIISSFSVIEGIFRDYHQISFENNEKPIYKINLENLEKNMLYSDVNALVFFSKFLNKIMSGKPEENSLHRNSVLHGIDNNFHNKKNSLILILAIFEFFRLENLDKLWPPKSELIDGEAYINGYKIEIRDKI